MPIDDAEKRRSAAGDFLKPGVTPNVDKDAEWRRQAAGTYSGTTTVDVPDPVAPARIGSVRLASGGFSVALDTARLNVRVGEIL